MFADEALLHEALRSQQSFLRLYRWDPPTLSIGRNQPETIAAVPTVRRPTGGQAVWHDQDVTYAVAAPVAEFGSLRRAYREIHARLALALRALGVDAALAPARPPVRLSARPGSCFESAVGGEILVGGRKLVGSAQVRRQDAFLQHGSILLEGSQGIFFKASDHTTLAQVLGRPVTFDEVAEAVITHWPSARPPLGPSVIASLAAQ